MGHLGCFSGVDVRKGERIWELNPIIDRVISLAELETLPAHTIEMIRTHAEYYPETSEFKLGADGDFFMNHSDDPNLENFGDFAVARRDIFVGDEITCDYRSTKVWAFPLE